MKNTLIKDLVLNDNFDYENFIPKINKEIILEKIANIGVKNA